MMERAFGSCLILLVLGLGGVPPVAAAAGRTPATAERQGAAGAEAPPALRALAPDGPRKVVVDAAGLTKSGRRMWAIEPVGAGDPKRPKLVLVGGLDGDPASTAIVMRVLQWWFTDRAAATLRSEWHIAALPCARPDSCGEAPVTAADADAARFSFPPPGGFFDGKLEPTPHYVWRWTIMQAPTVVIDVRSGTATTWSANAASAGILPATPVQTGSAAQPPAAGSFISALAGSGAGAAWSMPVPALRLDVAADAAVKAVGSLLPRAARVASPLRTTLTARVARAPLDVARLLAPKYPAQPIMSYIPALSWSGALRLARITGEARFRDKPIAEMTPFVSGAKPAIAEPYLLTSLAGHLALSDWGELEGNAEAAAVARKGADFMLPQGQGSALRAQGSGSGAEIVRFPRAWTDDMFMAISVLARVAARTKGDDRYAAAAGRLLTTYAEQLQRPDGIFIHAKEGPHAWGRGNGFAAFGLMEALTYLPAASPDRTRILQSYQALMKGLIAQQAPDGMWRQVVDEPGSYREFTVTAMVVTAMARGVRLGWLDASYRPIVARAWQGLLARIAEDGSLIDVCTGTGSGPTKQVLPGSRRGHRRR